MFFTVFLLLHFFAKLPDSKKDFTNWSGQEYLLCLDSRVYNLFTDFPTNMKPILFRIIHADNHPELFSSHCSNPEKMELPEPESNTSSRPPGIHQKQQKRGYYQEGVRWCLLKRKWKKTSVLVVNPTTHYSTIILLLLLIPLHSVSFFEFSVQFLIIKAKAT